MNRNLANAGYPLFLSSGILTGSTDWESPYVDTRDCDGVLFLVTVNSTDSITGFNVHAQMSATSSAGGTAYDVADSAAYFSTDWTVNTHGVLAVDVFRPMYRYVQAFCDRSSSGQHIVSAVALKYRCHEEPVSYSSDWGVMDVTIAVGSSGSATG